MPATTPIISLTRRNPVYITLIFATAFVAHIGLRDGVDAFWNWKNQGKQWNDIKHKYVKAE